ncbi:hypothetical protein PDE_07533 [Penicillium oxalicum 114-2]|uniref:C2H2-type domain-containing protein n=1 Tax=Penicillium oxalicum (strain 114-2 / CGMCC 5302) TaxID=933388 RepID=S8B193_PENO1|nr:hypothetical protein PDE_07533 [Penicillium oxalicum 114-2]
MIVQPTDTQINASMNTSLHPSRRPSNATEKRVSKAKKGKRVHVCEFPGCEKIFTRAEHRRRHELVHKSKKAHTCTFVGCHKSFHRPDYLMQHLARHGGVPGSTITGKPTSSKKSKSIQTGLTAESTRAHSPSPRSQTTTYTEMLKSVENVGTTCTQDYKLRYHTPDLVDSYTQENIHYGFSSHDIHGGIYTETTHSNPASTVSTISDSPGSQISTMAFAGVYHQPDLDRYMRRTSLPEAYLSPPQSLSPRLKGYEQVPPPYWYNDLDNTLPPIDPALFDCETSLLRWPSESDENHSAGLHPPMVSSVPEVRKAEHLI